jgi:hypothetical protein
VGNDPVNFVDPSGLSGWSSAWNWASCAVKVIGNMASPISARGNALIAAGIGVAHVGAATFAMGGAIVVGGAVFAGTSTAALTVGVVLIVAGTAFAYFGVYLLTKDSC